MRKGLRSQTNTLSQLKETVSAKYRNMQYWCTNFKTFRVHVRICTCICTVQFVLAFQRVSSGLKSLLYCYCFDHNNPERSSVESQYLPVIGASLSFREKKDPTDFLLNLLRGCWTRRPL